MIVLTAILVFVMLIFAPIRLNISVFTYPQELSATIWVRTLLVRVFDEEVKLCGTTLDCQGTVSTQLDLSTVNSQSGVDLLKCITVDRLYVAVQNNILTVSPFFIAVQNALAAVVTLTLCNLYHCQYFTQIVGSIDRSGILVEVTASVSVAELSFCLLKQGVKTWKIRKLGK